MVLWSAFIWILPPCCLLFLSPVHLVRLYKKRFRFAKQDFSGKVRQKPRSLIPQIEKKDRFIYMDEPCQAFISFVSLRRCVPVIGKEPCHKIFNRVEYTFRSIAVYYAVPLDIHQQVFLLF